MKNQDMFESLDATLAAKLFTESVYPWEVLPKIKEFVRALGPTLDPAEYDLCGEEVWIHKSVKRHASATIEGPTIVCAETEIRPSVYIRGSVLVGRACVVGNSTELKNCILFDHVQVPHYNYVGDSILGHYAHMGAGSICSNVKSDKTNVVVRGDLMIETGLRKFGAILGDHVEVGCNSVLNPGTVLEPYVSVYPLSNVRGVVKRGHIYKAHGEIVQRI